MAKTAANNIIKDFKIGNTKVKIATDFCDTKTSEDVQQILLRISRMAKQSFAAVNTKVHSN